jgi:hypothetical protein
MRGQGGVRAKIHGNLARTRARRRSALCALACAVQAAHGFAGESRTTNGSTRPAAGQSDPSAPDAGGGPPQPVLRGDGLWLGNECFAVCGFPEHTDPNANGDLDGWGFELQRACIVAGTTPALSAPLCDVVPLTNLPPPGSGVFREGTCHPRCSSALTDADAAGNVDGWGYERRRGCIVTGSAAALGGLPCQPQLPSYPAGDGVEIPIDDQGTLECRPLCRRPSESDPDRDGFGYESGKSCVVSASYAALQGVPCDAPDLPEPPPPAPPPPGDGWSPDYSASMFGELDCAPLGFEDPGDSDLNRSTCVSAGKVTLGPDSSKYFAAVGDLSTLWNAPVCQCSDGETNGKCNSPPACPGQTNCGQCVEVTCNATGTASYENDGVTHNEFCKPNRSVVVQLIDACPHNHPNNPYWCTERRKNHIDISCSAFDNIVQGRAIAQIGHINVYVRPVDCGVGLGVKKF